jgi:small-conductance mechanosensitive channel
VSEVVKFTQWALPLAYIIGGFLVGLIFEKIILAKLNKMASRTKWEGVTLIITSLRHMILIWFIIAGTYGAILSIQLPPKLVDLIHKILFAIIILSGTVVLARMTTGFVNLHLSKEHVPLPSTTIFINITKLVVFALGILIIFQSLGISITPLITALGVGGLAVALALQPTLSNLFSGLHILASRKIRPGDYIKLDTGEEGYVTDITWHNTTIRQLPNNMVIVPNAKLNSAIVINYYQPQQELAVLLQVGVHYESDLKKVERVTIEVGKEVMKEVQGGVPEFEPFIRYHTFADFSINFTVILRAKEYVDQYLIKHEFIKRLHERYEKEGIIIPFPIRTVYMDTEKK